MNTRSLQNYSSNRRGEFNLALSALTLFILLMVLEGAVRKWIFPALGTPLQVIRDVIPTLALLFYYFSKSRRLSTRVMLPPDIVILCFSGYLFFSFLSMALSAQDSLFIPILGFRTHFAYVPLVILVPSLVRNLEKVQVLLFRIALLGVPVCALAVYQSTLPSSHWLNIYGTGEEANAMFGDSLLVRATGTFSYITGMGYFSQFVAVISFFLLVTLKDKVNKLISITAFSLAILAAFSTGSRAVFFGIIIQISFFLILSKPVRTALWRNLASNIVLYLISFFVVAYFGFDQLEAFFQRVESVSGDEGWRISDGLFEWVDVLSNFPFGTGLGSAHQQAATFVGGVAGFGNSNYLPESELSRVALELGVLGFFFCICLKISVILYSWRVLRLSRDSNQKILAVFSFSYLSLLIVSGFYSPMANAIYWFCLGLTSCVRRDLRLSHK